MPRISIWATRIALSYFLIGFTFGAMLLVHKAMPLHPAIWSLLPLHIEFLLIGWVVQLVFAVGYWIFPRFKIEPKRGIPGLAWASLVLLNAGIGSVSMAGFMGQASWLFIGRVLEVGAVLVFAAQLWFRAKPTETGMKAEKKP
jgi:hypothetical protein